MTGRIAKYTADQIARKAVDQSFNERRKANDERWHAVSMRVWLSLVPKGTQEWLAQAPKGDWVKKFLECRVRGSNGYLMKIKFPAPQAMDRNWSYGSEPIIKDEKMTAELLACVQEEEKLNESYVRTYKGLQQSILAAGTFKKLELAWPEGRQYYASYLNAENTGTALTVDFKEVNKSLGLPKDEAAKPTPKKRKAA